MQEINHIFQLLVNSYLVRKCLKENHKISMNHSNNVKWSCNNKRTFVTIETLRFYIFDVAFKYNEGCVTKVDNIDHLGHKECLDITCLKQ